MQKMLLTEMLAEGQCSELSHGVHLKMHIHTHGTISLFKNNDTLIDIFDRMINVGTAENFTEEELLMFDMIERVTNGSEKLNMEGHHKCHNTFLRYA